MAENIVDFESADEYVENKDANGFDFSALDAVTNDEVVNTDAVNFKASDKYAENKNITVTNQSGKKSYIFKSLGLLDRYDELTDETKAKYPKEFVKGIDSEAGFNELVGLQMQGSSTAGRKITFNEARTAVANLRDSLFDEIVAKEYLVLQAGSADKIPEFKTRAALEEAFNAVPGANYAEPKAGKNGVVYGCHPCVENGDKKQFLWYSLASAGQIAELKDDYKKLTDRVNKDKTGVIKAVSNYNKLGELVSKNSVISLKDYEDLQKSSRDCNKVLDLDRHISPYYDKKDMEDLRSKLLESPDVLKAYTEVAKKHFKSVDLNGDRSFKNAEGKMINYKGVVCSGGYANYSQINELANSRGTDIYNTIKTDYLKNVVMPRVYKASLDAAMKEAKSQGRSYLTSEESDKIKYRVTHCDISVGDAEEVKKQFDAKLGEEKDKLARKTYEEASAEIGKLPVSESQKFMLNVVYGVEPKYVDGLNRVEARDKIKDLASQSQEREVSPQIRAYAEKYHLVKPGEKYVNADWNRDCSKVPPMDEFKKLAEDLNCYFDVVARYNYINHIGYEEGKKSSDYVTRYNEIVNGEPDKDKKCLSHADFVDVITSRYKKIDEKKNGPLESYQIKSGFGNCKNWYEAETGFLRKLCAERLLGSMQANYALKKEITQDVSFNGVKLGNAFGIPGCDLDKLLDSKLSRSEQLEMAETCRNAINKDMMISRKNRIYDFENGLAKYRPISYAVKVAIKNVCADCSSIEDYAAKTREPDAILNEVKKFAEARGTTITNESLSLIAREIIERAPGIVESREPYDVIKKNIVDKCKKVFDVSDTAKGAGDASKAKGAKTNGAKSGGKAVARRANLVEL